MQKFFQVMRKKGFMVLLLVFIIWFIFFLVNFFYPSAFNFLRAKNSLPAQKLEQKESIPLRFKIYNLFFRQSYNPFNNLSRNTDSSSTLDTNPKDTKKEDKKDGNKNSINQNTNLARNKNKLISKDLYIYPNTRKNAVLQNFRFDNLLVKENSVNILAENTIITGEMSRNYLYNYYFNIDIYDSNGDYIFSIPAQGFINPKDENLVSFSAINRSFYNPYKYLGDGFLVIWSDMDNVESVLISKIKID